jgi:hypothetical protein
VCEVRSSARLGQYIGRLEALAMAWIWAREK